MKKISFFLMAMLVSLTSFAAALGEGYSKVTDITTLSAGDKVVLYCDDADKGVTGWDGTKTATAAEEGWVEYVVEAAEGGVLLKDGEQYIALTAKNGFYYTATGSVCKVNAEGVLYITLDGTDYLLYENANNGTPLYRMYVDKTGNAQYKPVYVYEVVVAEEGGESEGEGETATVPTNAELWEAFKPYYNTFYSEARSDQPITAVATFMTKGEKILTDATSEYKWLGDYLLKVTNEQIADGTLKTYTGITTEVKWRFATQAFFNCSAAKDADYSGNADFTEAGKPENWGPYYLAAQGGTTPEPEPEPVMETVYFVNAANWTTVNVYAWTTDPNASWPGAAATKEAEQIAGYDVYSYTVEAGTYANVIFNNGSGQQTADLVWTAGKYYVKDGWYTKEEAEAKLAKPVEYEYVYFVNAQGWAKVNIYTWTPEVGTWPGVAMTKEAEQLAGYDVYSYKAEKGTSFGGVIFNNGSGTQTGDLKWTAGKYYVKDAWYTKEEAEAKLAGPVTPPVITYVLMGVKGDWTTGIALTVNPDNANEYVLLGQEILDGDAVKVVTLTDGVATAWCGNVDEYSVAHSADDMGNIVLAPGKYDFYYKVAEDLIYIGGEAYKPEIEWIPMDLEITNLTTEVLEVEGAKYLQLMGRNDMMDADVMLFLNNYADVDDDYVVNAENSLMTFGGMEFTVIEGVMTQTSETDKGTIYTGTVYASVTDEEEGGTMYVKFALTMYAAPATVLELTDAIVAINEELGTLTFNVPTGEGEGYYVELSGYTAPGVHEGPQICLLETPKAVAYTNYAETSVADGVITLKGEFTSFMGAKFDLTISGKLPVEEPEPAPLKGIVKRALTVGESTVVLTLEADGTAHIYNIKGENIAEVSLEGVVAVDTANLGDLLAISDIAVTEDGKLVAINYMQTQSGDDKVDAGYKRGETRVYLWNDLAGDPSILFTSKMSSNWFRSKQGLTMAVKGTSDNMEIFTTGIHATSAWARVSSYRVIDGVYVEPEVNHNDHYFFYDINDAIALETTVGTQYELNASPLGEMNWILDAELINPTEIVEPETNNVEIATSVALSIDLGKKYQGATVVADGGQVLMVAPYANAEGLLAGVKVLDITAGLAADSVIATLDLEAPVAATAAATAVAIAAYDVNITLVADGFIYNLAGQLPKPERTEETVLNPFAYNLTSVLSEDKATLTVNYTLNANAEAVEIVILNGEEVVKTVPCKGINKGAYTVNIPTAGLPETASLTWAVNVKGIAPAAAVENPLNYSLYHPSGLDIDNNPENATFGMLLVNEGMHSVKDKTEGYISAGFGAGIFAFTPDFMPIMNDTLPGFNGGIEFTTTRADGSGTAYSPRRIRISEDGRIFVTSLNTDGNYLWEVNADNMNEWTPIFKGTLNDNRELITEDSAFIAAPNNGFDVKGSGENLQLAMYSVNLPGITGAAMSGFRLHEYNLGTATEWATAPSKTIVDGLYAINYTGTQVEYDNEGGLWIASYRGTASDANPGLVHINADGVEDAKLVWNNVRQAGIRFNNDFTKLVVAGNNGAAKKATIYAVSKDANGAPVLTEEMVINMATVGNNLNDFAWDYAGNLYSCGNSAEKIVSWAMPYSGEVSTPAASKYAFQLTDPEPVYEVYEDEITNLVIDYDNLVLIGGPSTNFAVDVYLGLGEYNMSEDIFQLLPESSVAIQGQDATFVEGYATVDGIDQSAVAVVRCVWNGMNIELHLTMSSAPLEATKVVVENAVIEIEKVLLFGDMYDYALKMTGVWTNEGLDYPVLVEVPVYYPEATEPFEMLSTVTVGSWDDGANWLGFGEGYLTITPEGEKITATGVVENPMAGIAIDITISGSITPTGVENATVTIKTVKMIQNGQLIIKKGDAQYNAQGAIVK